MTILGRNRAPVATADAAATTEDAPFTVAVLANDTDPDGDPLAIHSVQGLSALGARVGVNLDGSLSYDPTGSARIQALAGGATAVDTITYRVTDGRGGVSTGTVTVTLTGRDDAPVAVGDVAATSEDAPVLIRVLANDTDPDGRAGLAVTAGTSDRGVVLRIDAQGRVIYDPRGLFDVLRQGETATDTFTYTVTDPSGLSDTASVTVTIAGRNDAPAARADTATVAANRPVVIAVLANDVDADAGAVLAVDAVSVSALGVAVRINPDGTVTYDPTGIVSVAPGKTRSDSFTYWATDGSGARVAASVRVTITAPVAEAPPVAEEAAEPGRRTVAAAEPDAAPLVVDLAAPYAGLAGLSLGAPAWHAGFVADLDEDPNRDLVVTLKAA